MKQHVIAFLIALAVWVTGNMLFGSYARAQARLASIQPAPNGRVVVTADAQCVQGSCWAWVNYTCNGHLPDCNGGCWTTGSYPCSTCIDQVGATCTQEQVRVNANLYRYPCTSSNNYDCNACNRNSPSYRFGEYYVTTWVCR